MCEVEKQADRPIDTATPTENDFSTSLQRLNLVQVVATNLDVQAQTKYLQNGQTLSNSKYDAHKYQVSSSGIDEDPEDAGNAKMTIWATKK